MEYLATLNGQDVSGPLAALLGVSLISLFMLGIFVWLLFVIAYWKMFTKAGEAGWKSIIPIYHHYVAYRLAWKDGTKNFWIWFVAMFIAGAAGGSFSATVNGSTVVSDGNPVMTAIAFVAAVVALVWSIRFYLRLARAYNKGTGCAILSIFFWNIMTLYYGFAGSAVYQGPQD